MKKTMSVVLKTDSKVPAVEFVAMLRRIAEITQKEEKTVGRSDFGDGEFSYRIE